MEHFNIKKGHGELELSAFGLKLRVNPRQLIQTMMNKNSQKMLDEMIERKYRDAIIGFYNWYELNYTPDEDKDLVEENERLDQKYMLEEHVEEIQNLADITRHLVSIHSNGAIDFRDEEIEDIDTANRFWRYKTLYGFEGTKETKI